MFFQGIALVVVQLLGQTLLAPVVYYRHHPQQAAYLERFPEVPEASKFIIINVLQCASTEGLPQYVLQP